MNLSVIYFSFLLRGLLLQNIFNVTGLAKIGFEGRLSLFMIIIGINFKLIDGLI